MARFTGNLNPNHIYTAIKNMIINQMTFADNIKHNYGELVDKARVEGGMYGDTILRYATDAIPVSRWVQDSEEMLNVLKTHRNQKIECQSITIDKFYQLAITTDDYMTKQAWSTPSAFSQFTSVMLGWLTTTQRIMDITTYNTFIGTNETDIGDQQLTITPVEGQNDALTIAVALADILTKVKDYSRKYNDYGFMRSYAEGDLRAVISAKHWNQLKKADLPVVFHNEGLLDEFDKVVLPERYFGTVVGDEHIQATVGADAAQTYRTLVEGNFTGSDGVEKFLYPGDELTEGMTYYQDEAYIEDDTIVFKLIHKDSVPFMSGFETGSAFRNDRNLSTNNYYTYGRNTLEHLSNYPFITARFEG